MALSTVYSHPIRQEYKAPLISQANIFQLITLLITIILPWLIVYGSQGMWIKTNVYREQPEVDFRHEFIMIAFDEDPANYFIWSTYPTLNRLTSSRVRIATVSSTKIDRNRDGLTDSISIDLTMPLAKTDRIHTINAILLFDYTIELHTRLRMQTAIVIQENSYFSAKSLHVGGDLVFRQRIPVMAYGRNTIYDQPIVNGSSVVTKDFIWTNILENYNLRNFTTHLTNQLTSWQPTTGADEFKLTLTLRIPEQEIVYYTGWWELLKWAWVQYLSILLIILFIMGRIRELVFRNRLVSSVPQPVAVHCRHQQEQFATTFVNGNGHGHYD